MLAVTAEASTIETFRVPLLVHIPSITTPSDRIAASRDQVALEDDAV